MRKLTDEELKGHYRFYVNKGGELLFSTYIHRIKHSAEMFTCKDLKNFIRYHNSMGFLPRNTTLQGRKAQLVKKIKYLYDGTLESCDIFSIGGSASFMDILSGIIENGMQEEKPKQIPNDLKLQPLDHYKNFKRFIHKYHSVHWRTPKEDFKKWEEMLIGDNMTILVKPFNGKHEPIEWGYTRLINDGKTTQPETIYKLDPELDRCEFSNYHEVKKPCIDMAVKGHGTKYCPRFVVEKLTRDNMIEVVKVNKLVQKSQNNDDDDLCLLNQIVDLKDPLLQERIKTYPVRTIFCKHKECFDLEVFIDYSLENPKNNSCPHCHEFIHDISHLYIDRGIFKLMNEHGDSLEKVIVESDGKTMKKYVEPTITKKRKNDFMTNVIEKKKKKTEMEDIIYELIE